MICEYYGDVVYKFKAHIKPFLSCIRKTFQHSVFSCVYALSRCMSGALPLSTSLTHSLPLYACLSFTRSLPLCVSHSLSVCVCVSLSMSLSLFSLYWYVLLLPVPVCGLLLSYLSLSISVPLPVFLSALLGFLIFVTLFVSIRPWPCLCHSVSLRLTLSVCPSVWLYLFQLWSFSLVVTYLSAIVLWRFRRNDAHCRRALFRRRNRNIIVTLFISILQQLCHGSLLISRANPSLTQLLRGLQREASEGL